METTRKENWLKTACIACQFYHTGVMPYPRDDFNDIEFFPQYAVDLEINAPATQQSFQQNAPPGNAIMPEKLVTSSIMIR